LKFIPISENIIKNKKSENSVHSNGPFGPRLWPVGLAQPQNQPAAPALRAQSTVTAFGSHARGRAAALTNGAAVADWQQVIPDGHEGMLGVALG
jgi:hypothetical protein